MIQKCVAYLTSECWNSNHFVILFDQDNTIANRNSVSKVSRIANRTLYLSSCSGCTLLTLHVPSTSELIT